MVYGCCTIKCEFVSVDGGLAQPLGSPVARSSPHSSQASESNEPFSRKVFVGGLPPDIDEGLSNFFLNLFHKIGLYYTLEFFFHLIFNSYLTAGTTICYKPMYEIEFFYTQSLVFSLW